jgi:ATP-dependent Clp protease ATP-binding subunit ClpC
MNATRNTYNKASGSGLASLVRISTRRDPRHLFERFTEQARDAVRKAGDEARALQHAEIGTGHILLGLLLAGEPADLTTGPLAALGITVERVRAEVERILGAGEVVVAGQIPIAPEAKTVLALSLRESLSLGHSYIGIEHLLLALLRQPEGDGARILTDLGADRRRFATR